MTAAVYLRLTASGVRDRRDYGRHPFHPFVTASMPLPLVARSRKTARISAGAATKSTMSPSSTWTMSAGTWPSVAAST